MRARADTLDDNLTALRAFVDRPTYDPIELHRLAVDLREGYDDLTKHGGRVVTDAHKVESALVSVFRAAEADIYTDAPECADAVRRLRDKLTYAEATCVRAGLLTGSAAAINDEEE